VIRSKFKTIVLFVCLSFVSVSANAGNIFTGPQEVVSILTNLNGSLFITLSDTSTQPACSTRTSYFLDANSATGAKGIYAMLLTAQASGQLANISVDDTTCTSTGYAKVTSAKIVP